MPAASTQLDSAREQVHQRNNLWQTWVLTGAMAALLMLAAYLFWSWIGVVIALASTLGLRLLAPSVAPEMVMRLFRAQKVDPKGAAQLYQIRDFLTARAGLAVAPDLYVVPSMALNAFSVGSPSRSAIAVTEGLLRKLDLRELTGVLAHELAHIKNDDLVTLGFADVMSRFMQLMSWIGIALVLLNLPSALMGDGRVPWLGIILLYLAPTASNLLQLALSRTREFDADLDAAKYTGDPEGLATALAKIEQMQGKALEDLMPPGARRVPGPSILRTHPHTEARLKRLREVTVAARHWSPRDAGGPLVTLAGVGPASMRPRYRVPGIWF